jgi:pyruvate/2-oxoglutarate dehydrogenase complex dihydrolipoamide dehydrogenase (E3) component
VLLVFSVAKKKLLCSLILHETMKEYDVIAVGTGSAMIVLDGMMQRNPGLKAAVIDKDEPGGICLTRGCIPSKILSTQPNLFVRSNVPEHLA